MPKLLQINTSVNRGSTGRIAEDLGDVAMSAKWESYIAYGRDCSPSHSHIIRIGNSFSVFSHVAISRLLDRHGFGSHLATKRLLKQIDRIKPDVIQFHNIHGYYVNIKMLMEYIANKNIPLIWSLHDCWSMTGHCSHFAMINCKKWKTGCHNCPQLNKYPKSLGRDASKQNFSQKKALIEAIPRLTIISASQWLGGIANQSYFKGRDIRIIPNGIDTGIYQPCTNGNELRKRLGLDNKFVIMGAGTVWLEYKGLYDFGKLREILSDDYAIILVGLTQEDINRRLPKGIIGIPRTKSPQELAEYYSMADCVMSLSRLESFGLTPVEGFACGTPAIVYNNTSLPELISPETGFVAEPGNIEDVKEKVEILRARGKSYYSENCRRIAVEKYSREKCFSEYLKVYESIIQ